MFHADAKTVLSALFLLFLFPGLAHPQSLTEPSREDTAIAIVWIPLRQGPPEYLRQVRIFDNASTIRYAAFPDLSQDTILFVERKSADSTVEYWLLGIRSQRVVGSSQLQFDRASSGEYTSNGLLRLSEEEPLEYTVEYSKEERRVRCYLGQSPEDSDSGPWVVTVGIRFEPSVIFGSYLSVNDASVEIAPAFSFTPMLRVVPSVILLGQIGYSPGILLDGFEGMEYGAYVRWTPFQERFYLLVGYVDYEIGGNIHNFVEIPQRGYGFLSLGGGMQLGPAVMADLSLLLPNEKRFGTVWDNQIVGKTYPKTVDAIVKLGFCFYYQGVGSTEDPSPP